MDSNSGVEIENLVAVEVTSCEEVKRLYKVGSRLRSTASTMANTSSSRSHCLIRLSLTSSKALERRRETNKMWMIDLGGSERLLKTQAKGRRLEEGKAINLSLSALGDVISALQSRKPHVPYRNSKLTQVLRDSLGSDSKTLMLVHVNPKEEDMCESICSLGFASRARKIHLGSEESVEVRAKKEIAMTDLLQKVKQFETERQVVNKKIEHLNDRLRCLTRTDSPIFQHLEASYSATENMFSSISEEVNYIKESKRTSKSLPRFMRPTICSQQKNGAGHQSLTSKTKKPPMATRNRKPSSVYAESFTCKSKGFTFQSDYGSDCNITANFKNRTNSTDDGSECSLGTSEYQTNEAIFPEQDMSPQSLMNSFSHGSLNKLEDSQMEHDNLSKNLIIDDWLQQQLKGKTSMTAQLRSAADEKEIPHCINNIYSETESKGVEIDLRKGSCEAERISLTSLLPMVDDEYLQNENYEQVTKDLTNVAEQQKDSAGKAIEDVEVIGQVYVAKMETLAFKENVKLASEESFGSDQCKDNPVEPCMLFIPSRRSLFLQKNLKAPKQKDSEDNLAHMMKSQNEEKRGSIGRNLAFLGTMQKLCATVLLGLGIQRLGFGHDFFDGLLL